MQEPLYSSKSYKNSKEPAARVFGLTFISFVKVPKSEEFKRQLFLKKNLRYIEQNIFSQTPPIPSIVQCFSF